MSLLVTTACVGALGVAGLVAGPQAATAAEPTADTTTARPTCHQVAPESLTAETTTETKEVYDTADISFEGRLPTGTPGNRTCVFIPASAELPLRSHGTVPAYDKKGRQLGEMVVTAEGVWMVFDDSYLASYDDVSFYGTVTAGWNVDRTQDVKAHTRTWTLPGGSTVTVNVPDCSSCGTVPVQGFKWASLAEEAGVVYSGVWVTPRELDDFSGDVRVTVIDKMGPGQECREPEVWKGFDTQVVATGTCQGAQAKVSFTADPSTAYEIRFTADVTDRSLGEYSDTATVTVEGKELGSYTANAPWSSKTAGGDGTSTPKPTLPAEPSPTPTPDPSGTPVPSEPHTPPVTPGWTETPEPAEPSTPVGVPAPTTPTAKPTPTSPRPMPLRKPAPKLVTRTFQVDRYQPRTRTQARVLASLARDRRLTYREDRPLWGASRWMLVTVRVPANATSRQVLDAVNARTPASIGDVRTTSRLTAATVGRPFVVAWELTGHATAARPWGPTNHDAQRFLARS